MILTGLVECLMALHWHIRESSGGKTGDATGMARIVVVDDDPDVREMLKTALARAGHRVAVAHEGEEALAICRQIEPDVVITDMLMKGKGGIETIIEVEHEFPDTGVIAMSGTPYLELAKDFGNVRTLTKPIDTKQLLDLIRELVAAKHS
jgi:DNA-binding NtrC family response regulator